MSNKIQSPICYLNEDAIASKLIDKHNQCWNTALIQEIFSPNEVKAITVIPISIVEKSDKLVWFLSKYGHFTIQSAYYIQHFISLSS